MPGRQSKQWADEERNTPCTADLLFVFLSCKTFLLKGLKGKTSTEPFCKYTLKESVHHSLQATGSQTGGVGGGSKKINKKINNSSTVWSERLPQIFLQKPVLQESLVLPQLHSISSVCLLRSQLLQWLLTPPPPKKSWTYNAALQTSALYKLNKLASCLTVRSHSSLSRPTFCGYNLCAALTLQHPGILSTLVRITCEREDANIWCNQFSEGAGETPGPELPLLQHQAAILKKVLIFKLVKT